MKRFLFSISALLLFSFLVSAQSQRLVLLEHFTQASCGPCATYNPSVQSLLTANPDKITSIKYQTSWPGTDPMNAQNPSDVGSRVSVYGVTGVPSSVIDGNYYSGHPNGWTINTVNARYAMTTPLEIQMQHNLNAAQDTVFVTMLIKATGPVSGSFAAHIGVIEKHIHFNFPPGSNGETDFYNVMKKLLPNSNGTSLPSSMAAGDYFIVQASWEIANFYDLSELGVVGWVQNRTSKEVFQAANSSTTAITPLHSNDAALRGITGLGENWCSDNINPGIVIRNQGSQPLTSAEIRYSVNGGAEQTHAWTGNLGFLDELKVTLPQGSFNLGQSNTIKAYIASVNGSSDEYHSNDTLRKNFVAAPGTSEKVYLYMKLDNKPEETTWEVLDAQGNVMYSGGPYSNSGQVLQETFDLADGCYTFNLYDAGNDGICCTSGYGVYQITSDVSGQVLGEGDDFGREAIHAFMVNGYAGVQDEVLATTVEIFPNPAAKEAFISYELITPAEVELEVMDLRGQQVYRTAKNASLPGPAQLRIPLNDLEDGLYLVHLRVGTQMEVLKLNVIH